MNTLRKTTVVRATAVLLLFVALFGALAMQASRTAAAPDKTNINILAIGDSITYGYWYNEPVLDSTEPYLRCVNVDGFQRACEGKNVPKGDQGDEASRRNQAYASYRVPLYQLLKLPVNKANFDVTFVGTVDGYPLNGADKKDEKIYVWNDPLPGYPETNQTCRYGATANCYPRPSAAEVAFVGWPNKETKVVGNQAGTEWRWMLKAALDQMKEEERYAKPDVALIHLGTNDVNGRIDSKTNRNLTVEQVWDQESKASYVSILNTLRTHAYGNPNIKIYIATIIPAAYPGDKCDSTPAGGINFAANCDSFEYEQGKKNQVERFNDKLKDWCGIEDVAGQEYVKRCKNLSTANSPVYLVDHYKYWTTHRDNSANILWLIPGDAVHPNRTGECRMAVTWYDAIADTEYADLDTAPGDFCDAYVEKYKTPVVDDGCEPVAGNLIDNFCFDRRRASWRFRMPAYGTFVASDVGSYSGSYAAEVTVSRAGKNTQLYQLGLDLEPNTEYELSFAAYSSDGGDMSVWVHQHRPPYTHYGLDGQRVRLDTSWQSFTYTFTTPDLADMDPARLRFWFKPYAQSGTVYHIDRVVLRQTP